jgi:hypothetical protein
VTPMISEVPEDHRFFLFNHIKLVVMLYLKSFFKSNTFKVTKVNKLINIIRNYSVNEILRLNKLKVKAEKETKFIETMQS